MFIKGFPCIFILYTVYIPISTYLVARCKYSRHDFCILKNMHFQSASAFRPHVYKGFPLYIYTLHSVHPHFCISSRPLQIVPPRDWFRLPIVSKSRKQTRAPSPSIIPGAFSCFVRAFVVLFGAFSDSNSHHSDTAIYQNYWWPCTIVIPFSFSLHTYIYI